MAKYSIHGGAAGMRRFEVQQMEDDRWSVSDQGRILFWYDTEEEAREAALAMASDSCVAGRQANIVISPTMTGSIHTDPQRVRRFTGM
jgi:hypothetical protein